MTKIEFKYGIFVAFFFVLVGCERSTTITESRNKTLIVSAFPETGQTLNSVSLRKFNDNGSFTIAVNDAEVGVVWKNNYFGLQPSGVLDGMYHINNSNFELQAENDYRIEINYKDQFITGETIMPAKLDEFVTSHLSEYPVFDDGGDLNNDLQLNWREANNTVYKVSITPTEGQTATDIIDFPSLTEDEILAIRTGSNSLFEDNLINIHPAMFTYSGKHLIEIIAVDKKYEDFFDLDQNGTTFSNIKNGKGYFIGISRETMIIDVKVN